MVSNFKTLALCNFDLQRLNLRVMELFDSPAV